jgi:hypothetical protein
MKPGLQIVSAGDRAARQAASAVRNLPTLQAYPPRELPNGAFYAGMLRNNPAFPVAIALTLITGVFAAAFVFGGPDPPPAWVPAVSLVAGVVAWMVFVVQSRRVRRLLEGGMPVRATVSKVGVNLFMHSRGSHRTTVEYDWTFAGQTRHSRTRGHLVRRERALVRGEELELVCDPSAPEDHLVPLFYGFRLEPF